MGDWEWNEEHLIQPAGMSDERWHEWLGLKCVEAAIAHYVPSGRYVTIGDIIYRAEKLYDWIRTPDDMASDDEGIQGSGDS